MYVTDIREAYQVLLEAITKLSFRRFPLPVVIKPAFGAPAGQHDNLRITINMNVLCRERGIPREIGVVVVITTPWERRVRAELERAYALTLYQSVRQAMLHELAECTEFEGRLLDDPHEGHAFSLRPEHDARFPEFRNGY